MPNVAIFDTVACCKAVITLLCCALLLQSCDYTVVLCLITLSWHNWVVLSYFLVMVSRRALPVIYTHLSYILMWHYM